jgi:cyclopropane-fatty-acyl-phospholipid synthase
VQIFINNREFYDEMNLLPAGLNDWVNRALHSPIPNTIQNALGNISAHYDLGNDMFAGFLDPSMTYSCPYWRFDDDSLEQAQYNKIHMMLDKLFLKSEHHLLEIGTGWGSLAIEVHSPRSDFIKTRL